MAKVPKDGRTPAGGGTPKSPGVAPGRGRPFGLPTSEELDDMFSESEEDDELDMSASEIAAANLSAVPMPLLAMLGSDERVAALLVALDPELSLNDMDHALELYEDLLISVLAEVRNQRREITDGPGSDNLAARGSSIHGKAAVEVLDTLLSTVESDSGLILPGFEAEELQANLATLKARV